MKKFWLSSLLLFGIIVLQAQDKTVKDLKDNASRQIVKDPNDSIPKTWKTGGLFTATFNQSALSNWSAGGENSSISLNTTLFAYGFYKKDRNSWDNTLNLGFGFLQTTSQGNRKSDDRIDVLSKYGYELSKSWYASLLFNARSQFAPGYSYPNSMSKILTSDFLSPAYVLLAPGINYKPNNNFSVFVSPATIRWLIVKNDSLSRVGAFGVDSGKNVKMQFGAYASITYTKKFSETAAYNGRLDLFSNYLHNPENISLYWTNMLAVKVYKLLSLTLQVNMVYDNDIQTVNSDGTKGGPKLQLQEIFGMGLAFKF